MGGDSRLPPLPYEAWVETRQTLHLICQNVGKVRMELHPVLNHWWHVPLYVGIRGLTTRLIPREEGDVEIRLDVDEHRLVIENPDGEHEICQLGGGTSVADVYHALMEGLVELGYPAHIYPVPFDCFTDTPFAEGHHFDAYDQEYVERYLHVLHWLNREMTRFRGSFIGKSSPVHLFWHSFDLAFTFFSGKKAPAMPDADPVTREAYSHEVISFGFWPGDEEVQMPALYSYTHPLPDDLTDHALSPEGAHWVEEKGGVTGILPFEVVRISEHPEKTLRQFLQSAFDAGAKSGEWPDLLVRRNDGTF